MPVTLRYGVATLAVLVAAVFAIAPFAGSLVERWSRHDVELRSILVFNSIENELTGLLAAGAPARVNDLFDRLALDETLLAAGYCDGDRQLRYRSELMPAGFSCDRVAVTDAVTFFTMHAYERDLLVAAFPLPLRGAGGQVVIFHDLSYAAQRSAQLRTWIMVALGAVVLLGAALAAAFVLFTVRRWFRSIRRAIDNAMTGRAVGPDEEESGFARQIHDALQGLTDARRAIDVSNVDWSPETLRLMLESQLPDAEIIVVSNREPYIHTRTEGGIVLDTPASGLVAAIEPVVRACGGVWIAHGSGSADREVGERVAVPPASPLYTLRRVWLSEQEEEGYYFGFSNEALWPLCHIAFVRPAFREADWNAYRAVNARFAAAVVAEATRPDPIVLVQDYHFALLPKMIRERLPDATIVTFWHIPWPNAETFGICPWGREIISGLLGSSVLGFHTQFHCNNFMETVDRLIESRIDRELASVTVSGHETFVRPYPISIEWPPTALAGQKQVADCRAAVRAGFGLAPHVRIGIGVERFDYTKGIIDRLRAVDMFLTRYPEWIGRFVFFQVAAPTRAKLETYRNLQDEAERVAHDINARHGNHAYVPIRLVVRHHGPEEVFELFRAADLCVVSSLHDGMNLVAKEFAAARDDEQGVLVLSRFAGASRELTGALIVNPYDHQSVGEAIRQGLLMSEDEQRERMRLMREVVRSRNVYRWAGQMLLDASQLRRRQEILSLAARRRKDGLPGAVRLGQLVKLTERTLGQASAKRSDLGR